MNLAALWEYMQFDLEADKFSQEMKQSPKRKMLLKQSEQLKDFQAGNARIDSEIETTNTRVNEIKSECERLSQLADELKANLGNVDEMNEEEVTEKLKPIEKLFATLENYEKELQKLSKDASLAERRQNDLKIRAAKLKKQYDEIKAEYDVEFVTDKKKLAALRKKVETEATKLATEDFEKYKQVKQHVTPPIAKLMNNQCTGCFMALSIGTLRDINAGNVRTCDNCGRILYPTGE